MNSWQRPNNWSLVSAEDFKLVSKLLDKKPKCEFQIVVRDESQQPLIIENAPFFFDGTPMPTRFWLLDGHLYKSVAHIESAGGVKRVQEEISEESIAQIHTQYEVARNLLIPPDHEGPRPTGGVGGTRRGVKCLHAHVANLLASGEDAVGQWTLDQIEHQAEIATRSERSEDSL